MNNNRGNNNRRRGRGNNRPQGGQQINRIDSRARGNAPQLLEKYKKLAHDAHLNGDRVTEEYNLQFADHYFRVIADQRQRQDDTRQPRRDDGPQDDRSQGYGDDYGSDEDSYGEVGYERSAQREPRVDREPQREPRAERESRAEREPRPERESRPEREARPQRQPRVDQARIEKSSDQQPDAPNAGSDAAGESEPSQGEHQVYEPVENPFVRGSRGLKQRKPRRRPQDGEQGDDNAAESNRAGDDVAASAPEVPGSNFDPAVLPPSISTRTADESAEDVPAADEKPRRRRARKPAPPADDAGALETVNG